jgi:hypothetical protein
MSEQVMIIIVIGAAGMVLVAVSSVVGGVIQSVLKTREKERSRREIAAYIAEGSMSADEGERLLDAGRPAWERELWKKRKG